MSEKEIFVFATEVERDAFVSDLKARGDGWRWATSESDSGESFFVAVFAASAAQ